MRVWDFLFVLLVLGPVITGGVWMHGPDFRIEYTQPGAAALVLAAALWWLVKKRRNPHKESVVVRHGLSLWELWRRNLEATPLRTLGAMWVFVSLCWFTTSLLRHRAFGSGLADLGIFTNAIWNVHSIGFPYSSIKDGLSLLADHQNYLVYPFGWIFFLWPSPVFLLLLQAFGLSSGAVALYLLCRQRVGKGDALVAWLPLAYWMCGPLRAANRFDFHPEVMMLPLFLFAAWLLQEKENKKRLAGGFLFLLALAAKESAGPVACGLGLAWIAGAGPESTRRFTRALGFAVVMLGISVFAINSKLVPQYFGKTYAYGELYAPFGASLVSLALAPFLQPIAFFGRLFSLSRIKFFFGTITAFAGLPLLAPAALLAALPGYLMLFLTNGDHRISLGYHYAIEPMVGLLFALPAALDSTFARKHSKWLLPAVILGSILSFGRSEAYFWREYQPTKHQAWVRDEVLPRLKKEKMVSASYAFVPHLSTRQWVHQLPILVNEFQVTLDCVVWDRSVNNTPMSRKDESDLAIMLKLHDYNREFSCGSFALYQKPGTTECLSEKPICPEGT